jgi:hypothetical protein
MSRRDKKAGGRALLVLLDRQTDHDVRDGILEPFCTPRMRLGSFVK